MSLHATVVSAFLYSDGIKVIGEGQIGIGPTILIISFHLPSRWAAHWLDPKTEASTVQAGVSADSLLVGAPGHCMSLNVRSKVKQMFARCIQTQQGRTGRNIEIGAVEQCAVA